MIIGQYIECVLLRGRKVANKGWRRNFNGLAKTASTVDSFATHSFFINHRKIIFHYESNHQTVRKTLRVTYSADMTCRNEI